MARKLKRITDLDVSLVSLLSKGANQMPGLLKSEDGVTITCLSKGDGVKGLLYSLVYRPNVPDSDLHYMEPEDVERACHTHMAKGAPLDLYHDGKALTEEQAYVVESSILTGHNPRFPTHDRHGELIKHEGAWGMVTQIKDPGLLERVKAGEITEVSLFAKPGDYRLVDGPSLEKDETNQPNQPNMDEKDLAAIGTAVAEALKPTFEALGKSQKDLAEALAKSEDTGADDGSGEPEPTHDESGMPIFKGDWNSRSEILEWRRACEDAVLAKHMKSLDPVKDGAKFDEALAKQEALAEARAKEDAAFAEARLGSQAAAHGLTDLGGLGKSESLPKSESSDALDAARKSAEAWSKRNNPEA